VEGCFAIAIFNTIFATQRLATRKALFYASKTELSTGWRYIFCRKKVFLGLQKSGFSAVGKLCWVNRKQASALDKTDVVVGIFLYF